MRIVLATPLYPPEISEPAPYAKELATRLKVAHEITIVTYALIPEDVLDVNIVIANKNRPLPIRLAVYTYRLWMEICSTDIVYAENGASVELPIILISLFKRKPIIFHIGDKLANEHTHKKSWLKYIQEMAFTRADKIITEMPMTRPEILPFGKTKQSEFNTYEKSWNIHMETLNKLFEIYAKS